MPPLRLRLCEGFKSAIQATLLARWPSSRQMCDLLIVMALGCHWLSVVEARRPCVDLVELASIWSTVLQA